MNEREMKILIKANAISKVRVSTIEVRFFDMPGQTVVSGFGSTLHYTHKNKNGREVFPDKDVIEYMMRIRDAGFKGPFELDDGYGVGGRESLSDTQIRILIAHGLATEVTMKEVILDGRKGYQVQVCNGSHLWKTMLKDQRSGLPMTFFTESVARSIVDRRYRREIAEVSAATKAAKERADSEELARALA
jgi:hypothetical protein